VRYALPLIATLLMGCADDLVAIPGTTTRVTQPVSSPGKELEMEIFVEPRQCTNMHIPQDEHPLCLPHVDRGSGEVRVGFALRDDGGQVYPLPKFKDQLKVYHQGSTVVDGAEGQEYTVIPHRPTEGSGTLYVLLIDGSASMEETAEDGKTRMRQVKEALRLPAVQEAFFPGGGSRNGVLLMQFTSGDPVPAGGEMAILDSPGQYEQAVKKLQPLGGFTHLYDAVMYATADLLQQPVVKRAVDDQSMSVTVIALTDGFNNLRGDDTCGSNAPRLEVLMEHLRAVRSGDGVDLRRRPTVHTVGLGRPLRPRFDAPESGRVEVTADRLCGRFVDRRIDGDIETLGIDNASLAFIASAGGGSSYVRQGVDALGEAFRQSASIRYDWFELRYRVDPFYLRRRFTTRLLLTGVASAEAKVDVLPSGWLDAPPGALGPDGWHHEQPYRHTMTVLLPALGLLVSVSFVGSVAFNLRRLAFGRLRRKQVARASAAPAEGPPEGGPPAA